MKDINILKENGVDVDASLELFGDMDLYDETIVDFLNSVGQKLFNMKKYKEAGDMKNYAILAHSLKSDARYLGFTKLGEIAYEHELKSKENNYGYVLENFNAVLDEAKVVIGLAQKYIGVQGKEEVVPKTVPTKKLLVVDDSDIIRNIISKIFVDEFEVLTANDGREAIEVVASNPNIIGLLLDLNMPNVDGFEVLNFFKDNDLFSKIPVSIITGDDSKETTDKAFEYKIVDVLNKPFNESNVKRVVNAMLELK